MTTFEERDIKEIIDSIRSLKDLGPVKQQLGTMNETLKGISESLRKLANPIKPVTPAPPAMKGTEEWPGDRFKEFYLSVEEGEKPFKVIPIKEESRKEIIDSVKKAYPDNNFIIFFPDDSIYDTFLRAAGYNPWRIKKEGTYKRIKKEDKEDE